VKDPALLIVDDHVQVRKALRDLVRASFPHCRVLEAGSGEDAVEVVCAEQPDIVLMDILLPGINGIEATRRIKEVHPLAQVVIVSIHDSPEYRRDAQAAGAAAYVFKNRLRTELVPAVNALWAK
jgi:two-component system, NarL family, response regulator DegU